jgi:hypothetical protein
MNNPHLPSIEHKRALAEILLLAMIAAALTIGAASAYPIWDDRRLLLLIETNGIDAINASFGIRPLIASWFTFLFNHRLLLPVALVFHFAEWLAMGLITVRLWKLMFPAHAKMALLPALLSVAPVLCKVQLVTFTVVFIALFAIVVGYAGVFLLLSDQPTRRRKLIVDVAGLALAAFATLISEYGTLTAIVGCVLLISKAIRVPKARRRQPLIVAALLAISVLLFYALFLTLGSRSNPGFLPSYSLQFLSWRIGVIPFRLLSGIWRGAMGGFLESLAAISVNSKIAVLSCLSGAVVATLAGLVFKKRREATRESGPDKQSIVTLLVTTAVALIPVLLMDRMLEDRWDSRFYLPLLPVLSSLTVIALLSLVRRRFWLVVVILCGFVAGYWTAAEIAWTLRNRESVRSHQLARPPVLTSIPVRHLDSKNVTHTS